MQRTIGIQCKLCKLLWRPIDWSGQVIILITCLKGQSLKNNLQLSLVASWLGVGRVRWSLWSWSQISKLSCLWGHIAVGSRLLVLVVQGSWDGQWTKTKKKLSLLRPPDVHCSCENVLKHYSHRLQSTTGPSDRLPRGFFWAVPICDGCEAMPHWILIWSLEHSRNTGWVNCSTYM